MPHQPIQSDLAVTVGHLLAHSKPVCGVNWGTYFFAVQGRWKQVSDQNEQVRLMNIFWRYQLASLSHDTSKVRNMLFDNVTPEMWITNFKRHVLPTVLEYNLPRFMYLL